MLDINKTSSEGSINLNNSEKKEIAKQNSLVILILNKNHNKNKENFSYTLLSYIDNYFKKSWLKDIDSEENNNQKIRKIDYINNSSLNIITEKLFKEQNLHEAIFSNIENYLKKNNLTLQNLESLEIIN